MSDRTYPEIEFVETDTETIESNLIALYEEMTDRTVYPASPERLFIAWMTAVVIQQRVLINDTAKKNVPRYAKDELLDSLAELFRDTERLTAGYATAPFRCYISTALQQAVIIPAGTRITVDGEIIFATTDALVIPAGQTYGDVNGKCQTAGTVGNGFTPGQVKQIVDVYDYYLKVENTATTSGGSEEEDDDSYYERMRESMESYSTAGPTGAYQYYAKSVSSAISDVAATTPAPGSVDIRILLENGEQATEALLEEVRQAVSADNVRPLTDYVTVSVPDADLLDIDLTYYIPRLSSSSASVIDAAVITAVEEYKKWQTAKMGRDINPSYLMGLLMNTGIKRADIRKPVFAAVAETHVAKVNTQTVVNGGVEDG
jgi:phage-related baseplate assembly protein